MEKTQARTQEFYEWCKFPGPDAIITYKWADHLKNFIPRDKPFTFLDAGCGAGQHTAGILLSFPQSRAVGIDLSKDSLSCAKTLMQSKKIDHRTEFYQRSFCEPVDFDVSFDLIIASGSIHHSEQPALAFQYLSECLRADGLFAGMIYSKRSNERRLQIKEMLEIMVNENLAPEENFSQKQRLVEAYRKKYPEYMDMSLREIVREFKKKVHKVKTRLFFRNQLHRSYNETLNRDIKFGGDYLFPIDKAYDSLELRAFLEAAGLELIQMFALGRPDKSLIPPQWQSAWSQLDLWEQVRISELIQPFPVSFSFLARKGESGDSGAGTKD